MKGITMASELYQKPFEEKIYTARLNCRKSIVLVLRKSQKGYVKSMPISKVKIGDVFGDLTIIADSGKRGKDGSIIWRCKCSCGNENYETVSAELRRAPPRNKTHCNNSIHSIKDVSG